MLMGVAVLGCRTQVELAPPDDPPPVSDVAIGRARAAEQQLAELADQFLADYFEAAPVNATSYGEHAHDHRWPDLSLKGREADERWRLAQIDRLSAIPREDLDADGRLELDVIRNQLELWGFANEVEQIWRSDPLAYSYLISAGLDDLIRRDFAPLDARAASVAGRLEGLPALIDQAIENLSDPSLVRRPQAEVALSQLDGLRILIETDIPERTAAASPELRERIVVASLAALGSVEELRIHLEALVPEAKGNWRLGRDMFSRKLALTLQTDLSADELLDLAHAEHERVRQQMWELAMELAKEMYQGPLSIQRGPLKGVHPSELHEVDHDLLVRGVLDELAADHPSPNQLRDAAAANLERLHAFVKDRRLVPLDEAEVLEVIWTPPHAQGVAIAGLAAPAPLDATTPGLPSFYLVQPLPTSWGSTPSESFLREYNTFMLEILSIHEAIPGHFVQLYWGKRETSRVRKVFDNGAFVEGWAVYTERVMVDAGYAGAPPSHTKKPPNVTNALWKVQRSDELRAKAIRLHGLKFYLRTVTNAILDHEIHARIMTREEAIELMVERSFQEDSEARTKWVRAQVTSTQLSTYFVGATAWFRLREQAEQRAAAAGETFDLLEFHRAALAHGAPPVHRLPELMNWD